jgi:hypothetical protein
MVAALPPPLVKKNPKPRNPQYPASSQPVHITSNQPRASPYSQPKASPSRLRPARWEPACADCIQLAKNHLRVSMSGLSRSSSAGQKSARPNHIQLTKSQLIQIISSWPRASLSWPCPTSRELARPNRIQRAESRPISIVSSLQIASLSRACPPVSIVSRNSTASPSLSRPGSRTCPDCIQPVESKPISIGSRNSRASLSRLCPTTGGPARPDHIQPTHLDRFQQVESHPHCV